MSTVVVAIKKNEDSTAFMEDASKSDPKIRFFLIVSRWSRLESPVEEGGRKMYDLHEM